MGRMWKKRKGQRGFSLIEILVAITIMLLVVTAFVPLFVFVAEASQANRARLVATKLASNQVEYIRSLPYHSIGTVGGNPEGDVDRVQTHSVGNTTYTITTDVWWVDDPSDNVAGVDLIPYDYKRVRVVVTAPGLFSGSVTQTLRVNTLGALEGEEEAFPGGNIRARVHRGWQTTPGEPVPVENVKVSLTEGPDTPQTIWTSEVGQALFAILESDTYMIGADPSSLGMMVHPLQESQEVEVTEGVTSEVIFEVEYPCHLAIILVDDDTGDLIDVPGIIVLDSPVTGRIEKAFSADQNGILDASFFGDLWPVGEGYAGTPFNIEVYAEGYMAYDMQSDPSAPWDGTFGAPGETRNITLRLVAANSSVTVTAAGTSNPVSGALVTVYGHKFTYEVGGWVGEHVVAGTGVTSSAGLAQFHLADNEGEPPSPSVGDSYTPYYCVEVSADGYVDFGPVCDAFRMEGGTQVMGGSPVDTYTVQLEADFRQIRVRAQRTNGNPRNNVRIRVIGPGYDVTRLTGSQGVPGEVIFEDLAPGAYQVERYYWFYWTDRRDVDVVYGEYYVLYIY